VARSSHGVPEGIFVRTLKLLAGALTLGALALVLTSCGSSTSPLSFTLFVPNGISAHATIQGSDGHVISTQTVNAGTQQVDLAGVPPDALVTVSMYAPNGNANHEKDYYNLTVPASLAVGHKVMLVQPIDNNVPVTVTFTCPAGATTVSWAASGIQNGSSVACSSGTFTVNSFSTELQSDGTISILLIAYNGTTPVSYAKKLDQDISSGTITVASGDWSTGAPSTYASTMDFPALPANEGASMTFQANVTRLGQTLDVLLSPASAVTSTTGATSLSVSAPGVPISGASYNLWDTFGLDYSDSTGLSWTSQSLHAHQATSLPAHQTIDTTASDLWPTLNDAHWVSNGGSPALSYQTNPGLSTATFAMANVYEKDTSASPAVVRSWAYFGNPNATAGTFQFPQLPSALSAYVPHPVATPADNQASLAYTDFEPLLASTGLIGLVSGMTSFPIGTVVFAAFGPGSTSGLPNAFHVVMASTNHITTSAVGPARPYIGLR
jgi:hypothetical protein